MLLLFLLLIIPSPIEGQKVKCVRNIMEDYDCNLIKRKNMCFRQEYYQDNCCIDCEVAYVDPKNFIRRITKRSTLVTTSRIPITHLVSYLSTDLPTQPVTEMGMN